MFTFNKKYSDYSQVEEFLPAFLARAAELKAAGKYPYNDSFKGHVPGIEGPDEDSAIYMLKGLEELNKQNARIAELIAAGFQYITTLDKVSKFRRVVLYPTNRMGGEWAEFEDARVIPYEDGAPRALLPKGKRTNGHLVSGRAVLALV